jgi:hypothetical protein
VQAPLALSQVPLPLQKKLASQFKQAGSVQPASHVQSPGAVQIPWPWQSPRSEQSGTHTGRLAAPPVEAEPTPAGPGTYPEAQEVQLSGPGPVHSAHDTSQDVHVWVSEVPFPSQSVPLWNSPGEHVWQAVQDCVSELPLPTHSVPSLY